MCRSCGLSKKSGRIRTPSLKNSLSSLLTGFIPTTDAIYIDTSVSCVSMFEHPKLASLPKKEETVLKSDCGGGGFIERRPVGSEASPRFIRTPVVRTPLELTDMLWQANSSYCRGHLGR